MMIKQYLENIAKTAIHGDQREESYYRPLSDFVEEYAVSIGKKKVSVTTLPKKTEAGNPDFRIWDGENHIVGYIEAKIPGTDLDRIEVSEQLTRYLNTFPNVILTDFYEFRLYRNGDLIEKSSIGRPFIAKKLKTKPPVENEKEFIRLLERFFDFSLPKIYSAETLATELAKRTRFLRDEIITVELDNKEDKKNHIHGFYKAFQKYLIAGLIEDEFADLYSQTIAYGLFTARTRSKEKFNRRMAVDFIPPTIGILRDVFEFISLGRLPEQMQVIIDDIAEVLYVADITKLLNDFYKKGKGDDPIIHFYETFLQQYDSDTRENRGVYYTPEPVVNYIVNSVSEILINEFDKTGFSDTSVKVLDPAGGTLTFLAQASKKAINEHVENFGDGNKSGFIKKHILKNFYGFELMMAPYAIAHLKMSYLLQEHGYKLEKGDRFQLYLTNTLEAKELADAEIPGMSSLAEESHEANVIKKKTPILAIIGNPPYSISSYNDSKFATEIMQLYKEDVKDEKNIQLLSDDYIKFVRFCHWKIENSGKGVIGLITKNTYLNIAAAKGMRKQLLLTFDKIYILNLHGKLYEKTPDGGKDQNVFDIRVGTAIMLLIKTKTEKKTTYAKLYYKDLYGERDLKYEFLNTKNVFLTFTEDDILPEDAEHFFFEKKNYNNPELYNSFFAIDEILIESTSGVTSGRDHFVLAENTEILTRRLNNFISFSIDLIKETYNINDASDFDLFKVKEKFKEIDKSKFHKYSHKPFNDKFIYYDNKFVDRDRKAVMKNFINEDNIGLIIKKRHNDKTYKHVFTSNYLVDKNFLGGQTYIFPIWIYKSDEEGQTSMYKEKLSNFNNDFEKLLEKTYNNENITEQIFYYIYAVLYSRIYRTSFPELLKIGYPKIPFTKDYLVFKQMSSLGKELSDLHLLKSKKLNKPVVKFNGQGSGKIEKPKYIKKDSVIYINPTQYFDNISPELWNYEIGKNKVIQRWVKGKEKVEMEDAMEFSKIATAIYETFKVQDEIDKVYPEILNNLLENN